ncbi:uncharacterized protein LOC112341718 [Selaginella moellendorffii]|uniref:uncharacterized protein LOC112341718 n=1 Tax=Selaginella moellendorffii TaxID=88036 RepID=UPI000D1CEAB5|nr:uncharacterized protein LOC112341718 [Selaginella moellendorffii]|eukprot:XP_024518085.1 uncharacterized protein LOC112341718 [Selaginella moellendorffii]
MGLELEEDEEAQDEEAVFLDLEFPHDGIDQPTNDVTSSEEEQAELDWHSGILAFTTSILDVRTLKLGIDVKHRDLLQVFMYVDHCQLREASKTSNISSCMYQFLVSCFEINFCLFCVCHGHEGMAICHF